jgi:hypothetical protein
MHSIADAPNFSTGCHAIHLRLQVFLPCAVSGSSAASTDWSPRIAFCLRQRFLHLDPFEKILNGIAAHDVGMRFHIE